MIGETAFLQVLYEDAHLPTKSSNQAAGFDLYAHNIKNKKKLYDNLYDTYFIYDKDDNRLGSYSAKDKVINIYPQCSVMIGTGIACTPPSGTFGAIFPRSGIAAKQHLRPSNCVGVCDRDYTGEYIVSLHNDSNFTQLIHLDDRIAQLVFLRYSDVEFELVQSLEETDRGAGGFGSTGQ